MYDPDPEIQWFDKHPQVYISVKDLFTKFTIVKDSCDKGVLAWNRGVKTASFTCGSQVSKLAR